MAHGLEPMASIKLRITPKGLVGLLFATSCLFGEGMNRAREKEELRKAGRQKEGRQMLL